MHKSSGSDDQSQISCCISCGDRNVTDEFIELFRPFEGPDVILAGQHDSGRTQKKCPRRFIGNSAYIRMFLKPGLHKKRLTFDVSEVCRRHLRGECDKGTSCKFLHVCRQWWKASQPQSSTDEHVCLSCGNVTKGRTLQCTECPGALSQLAFAFIHDLSKSVQTVETQWTNWIFSQAGTAAQAQAHASQGLTLRQRRQRLLQAMQHASESIREDESAHSDTQPQSGGIPPAHLHHAAAPSEGPASSLDVDNHQQRHSRARTARQQTNGKPQQQPMAPSHVTGLPLGARSSTMPHQLPGPGYVQPQPSSSTTPQFHPPQVEQGAEPQSWDPVTFNQILRLLQPVSSVGLGSLIEPEGPFQPRDVNPQPDMNLQQ